jgi:hypothetical protein
LSYCTFLAPSVKFSARDKLLTYCRSLLFAASSGISILYTIKSKKHPQDEDPWLAPQSQTYATPSGMEIGGQSKDPIWDTNTQELDGLHDHDHDSRDSFDSTHNMHNNNEIGGGYASVSNTETDEGIHPGRPWGPLGGNPTGGGHVSMPSLPMVDTDTEYRGATNYQAPSALSPDAYSPHRPSPDAYSPHQPNPVQEYGSGDEYGGRPTGGAGYSFSQPTAPGR